MIAANQYKLSWEHFDDLNPDKRTAFENLCRSLFGRTKIRESQILHSNPNHPGVEVAPVYSIDGKEKISFQAKYFDGNVDYGQIRNSMSVAVSYYKGVLNRIYLYCNQDLHTNSRAYLKIEKMVNEAGIEITPITAQSVLNEAMNYPAILACYFGLDCLDQEWFEQNMKVSLENLGRRYNVIFNIDTNAQQDISLFLREDVAIDRINVRKDELIEDLNDIKRFCNDDYKCQLSQLVRTIKGLEDVSIDNIEDSFRWSEQIAINEKEFFQKINHQEEQVRAKLANNNLDSREYEELRNEEYVIGEIKSVPSRLSLSEYEKNLLLSRCLLITGEMGTGKSQLLATSAKRLLDNNRFTLLLLGQTFISEEPIESQIMSGLVGIDSNESFEALLGVMEEKAFHSQRSSVIFIDAINESKYKELWKQGLNKLISVVEQYKHIQLVISLRSGFESLILSDRFQERVGNGQIVKIEHKGLPNDSPKAIYEFLSNYGIPGSPEYFLQQEMSNPLFLTWFCQTYTGEEHDICSLIDSVLKKADEEASIDAGYKEPIGFLRALLMDYMEASRDGEIIKKQILAFESWGLYGVADKIAYLNSIERAGVLTTYVKNDEEYYYISYNLLEDYLRSSWIIKNLKTKESVKNYCLSELLGMDSEGKVTTFGNESIIVMTMALCAEKYHEECIEIIDSISEEWYKTQIAEDYIRSFTWRNPKLTLDQFVLILDKYNVSERTVWDLFFECSTKEESVLNADGLTWLLNRYPLNKRDLLWTTNINELTEFDRVINLAYYLESGNELNGLSKEKKTLLMTLFAWMLSSTNKVIRDRISKAMIEVIKRNIDICCSLLIKFKDVNDPYIIQRLYGVFLGAILKRNDKWEKEFEKLAVMVYSEVFDKELVYPDILLRDYARLIIERFLFEYPEKNNKIDINRIKPPYRSIPIPEVDVVDYSNVDYTEGGLWRLLFSIKFDLDVKGVGMYGDFGRYVFQSALGYFKDVDIHNIYYYAVQHILHDLGYSNELFGEYDTKKADFDRHHARRIERIGKKYEWITLYNILARLSDSYNVVAVVGNNGEGEIYSGPWYPFVRNFDPTLNARLKTDNISLPIFKEDNIMYDRFISKDSDEDEIQRWVFDDGVMHTLFPKRFIRKDQNGNEWVSMYMYQEVKRNVPSEGESSFFFQRGEQRIWASSSMYILDCGQEISLDGLRKERRARQRIGMDAPRNCYSLYSREYAWSPGYFHEFSNDNDYREGGGLKIKSALINALWEAENDASQDETTSFYIPAGEIIQELNLYQKDIDGVFYYNEEVAALDTKVTGSEIRELLIKKDLLDMYVQNTGSKVFWNVIGEKQFFLGNHNQNWQRWEGFYIYSAAAIEGNLYNADNL